MKSLINYILFAVILLFNINTTYSQSIQILSCDTLVTGDTNSQFVSHSVCKNITTTDQNIRIKINIISLADGQDFNMCDLNNCYPNQSSDYTTPFPFLLKAGASSGVAVHVELFPNGHEGTSKLTFKYYIEGNETDFAEYTATFTVGTAGVNEDNTAQNKFANIYPNPANDFINVTLPVNVGINQGNVEIYNTMGLLVKSETIKSVTDNLNIKTKDLNNGSYLLVVKSGGNKIMLQPFIIYR